MAKRGGRRSSSLAAHAGPSGRLFEPEGYGGWRWHSLLPPEQAVAMALVFETIRSGDIFPSVPAASLLSSLLPAEASYNATGAGELPGCLRAHGALLAGPVLSSFVFAHSRPRHRAPLVTKRCHPLVVNLPIRLGKGAPVGPSLAVGSGPTNSLPGLFRILFRDGIAALLGELSFLSRGLEHRQPNTSYGRSNHGERVATGRSNLRTVEGV